MWMPTVSAAVQLRWAALLSVLDGDVRLVATAGMEPRTSIRARARLTRRGDPCPQNLNDREYELAQARLRSARSAHLCPLNLLGAKGTRRPRVAVGAFLRGRFQMRSAGSGLALSLATLASSPQRRPLVWRYSSG